MSSFIVNVRSLEEGITNIGICRQNSQLFKEICHVEIPELNINMKWSLCSTYFKVCGSYVATNLCQGLLLRMDTDNTSYNKIRHLLII